MYSSKPIESCDTVGHEQDFSPKKRKLNPQARKANNIKKPRPKVSFCVGL